MKKDFKNIIVSQIPEEKTENFQRYDFSRESCRETF